MRLPFVHIHVLSALASTLCVTALVLSGQAVRPAGAAAARGGFAQECAEPGTPTRDPANPLELRRAPGGDPLAGARLFVPGPAKGEAAGAIARLLGLDPAHMRVGESWRRFRHWLATRPVRRVLAHDPSLTRKVRELSLIAAQPEVQRIQSNSWGGTPLGIFRQTQKILCRNLLADRGSIPIFNTYFLHPTLGGCPTPAAVRAYLPLFRARVDAMARAVGRRRAVFLLELDAIGSSHCVARMHALPEWEAALRFEMRRVQALPHTVVYVEGGYSDADRVGYTSRILRAIHIRTIRGFYVNDTHAMWTSTEDRYATRIARRVHGSHFIVNTADNGRGPLLNPHPRTQGIEDLCNPPGRGIGIRDTTRTGLRYADAYLWTHPPGNSSGCGGGPPSGTFWPHRAEQEARNANDRLGPRFPSQRYFPASRD